MKKLNLKGLLKKVQILGARGVATEAYVNSTLKETRRGKRRRWAFFNSPKAIFLSVLVCLGMVLTYVLFGSFFQYLIRTWRIDPFYYHGLWVVGLSVILYVRFLWLQDFHHNVAKRPLLVQDHILFILLFILSAVLFILGVRTGLPMAGGVSFVLWMISLHILIFGLSQWKEYSFPFVYFLTVVPLPYLGELSGLLQLLVATLSQELFYFLGYPLSQQGITLSFPHATFQIAADCTGLKSWLVLFSVGLFFIYFLRIKLWLKCLFILFIFPISFVSNLMRVIALLLVGYYKGEGVAMKYWHDFGGLTFYLLACVACVLLIWIFRTKNS